MKFIHAAVSMSPSAGVVRQMADEEQAAADLGIDWNVWLCQAKDLGPAVARWPSFLRYSLLRIRFYFRLAGLARRGHRIVLRYSPGDPFLFIASYFLGRYYTVHHTLEESELAGSRFPYARLQVLLERSLGRRVVARAAGVICVTPEIARHQLGRIPPIHSRRVLIYPNGIRYPQKSVVAANDRRGTQPEVIFVASYFFGWHGLEALLDSMSASTETGVLHIVGTLPDAVRNKASADSRAVIHGALESPRLEGLIARSWAGLSSFGLADKGMTEACTLKVRDFLRAGLPVYAGHRDSALPPDFRYFVQGLPDWADILVFARKMRGVQRSDVAGAARPWIDKTVLLERLFRSLEGSA